MIRPNKFVILLVAMISLDMPSFRIVVAMVPEFASFNILHHNTLLKEIIMSSTRITRVNYTSIPQFMMIHFHMQRFKFIDFMVIELR